MVTTTIPLLPCLDQDRTVELYEALGLVTQYRQRQPYSYLALGLGPDVQVHFKAPSPRLDPVDELSIGELHRFHQPR